MKSILITLSLALILASAFALEADRSRNKRHRRNKNKWPKFLDEPLTRAFKFHSAQIHIDPITKGSPLQKDRKPFDSEVDVMNLGIFIQSYPAKDAFRNQYLKCNEANQCLLDFRLVKGCVINVDEGGWFNGQTLSFTALNLERQQNGQVPPRFEAKISLYYKLGSGFFGGVDINKKKEEWGALCSNRKMALESQKKAYVDAGDALFKSNKNKNEQESALATSKQNALSLSDSLKPLEAQKQEKNSKITGWSSELENANVQQKKATTDLSGADQAEKAAKSKLQQAQNLIKDTQSQIDQLATRKLTIQKNKQSSTSELEQAQNSLSIAEKNEREANKRIGDLATQETNYKSKFEAAQKAASDSKQKAQAAKETLGELTKKEFQADAASKKVGNEIIELKLKLKQLEEQHQLLKSEHQIAHQQSQDALKKEQEALKESQKHETSEAEAKNSLDSVISKKASAQNNLNEITKSLPALREKVSTHTGVLANLQKELENVLEREKASQAALTKAKADEKAAQESEKAAQAQKAAADNLKAEAERKRAEVSGKISTEQKDLGTVVSKINQVQGQISQVSQTISSNTQKAQQANADFANKQNALNAQEQLFVKKAEAAEDVIKSATKVAAQGNHGKVLQAVRINARKQRKLRRRH